jgi:drug/metabolite transporter (DMT)-like permease
LLGAARTSAYYAIAPFIGTLLSLVIFRELPGYTYFIAFGIMIIGAWLCSSDEPIFKKTRGEQ